VLRRGSVIRANIPDPAGKQILDKHGNPIPHPALVLSSQEDIDSGRLLVVAAITRSFKRGKIPSNWFLMESHPNGHPVTGLTSPCVVKANWIVYVRQQDVLRVSPGIATRQAKQVLNWLDQDKQRRQQHPPKKKKG
jgi:hypothetical protein